MLTSKTKKKKVASFQKLVARIERSNASFKRAGQAKKIMMVAQDVLDLLKAKRLTAVTGYYMDLPQVRADGLKDISEVLKLPKLPACDVCAIGAAMVASTVRLNGVPIEIEDDGYVRSDAQYKAHGAQDKFSASMSDRARSVFPDRLLRSMEEAFENCYYGYEQPHNDTRLSAIYENIVKNKGKKFTTNDTDNITVWSVGSR
jgi:hypothetical protein